MIDNTTDDVKPATVKKTNRGLVSKLGGLTLLASILAGAGLANSVHHRSNLFSPTDTGARTIADGATLDLVQDQAIHLAGKRVDNLSPTPEALGGMFDLEGNPLLTNTPPLPESAPKSVDGALTPLEAQINKVLMEQIDPPGPFLALRQKMLDTIPNTYPVPFKGVTSGYGFRKHPTTGKKDFHRGIDLRAAMRTPVHATADGVVEFAGFHKKSGYGRMVILHHNYGFRTTYAHLSDVQVKSGTFIRKGDQIGLSGNSGLSNGPHLHYEVRFIHRQLNPRPFLEWGPDHYQPLFQVKQVHWRSMMRLIAHRVNEPVLPPLWLAGQQGEFPLGMDKPETTL